MFEVSGSKFFAPLLIFSTTLILFLGCLYIENHPRIVSTLMQKRFQAPIFVDPFEENVFASRSAKLQQICQKYNLTEKKMWVNKFNYILCLNQYQFCYCPNAKVGTTTWMKRFMVHYC